MARTLVVCCYDLVLVDNAIITVGERTVALKIIARCSITQTPSGQWNIDNFAV